jgi:hypothetical protein
MSVKIYKITSSFTDKVYIGQTKKSLNARFGLHKLEFNGNNQCSSRELLKFSDAKMELIEECDFETRKDRERHYINLYGDLAVNKQKPTRSKKEYREAHREAISNYQKEYRKANREELIKKDRQYYSKNREEISKKNREYREKNRDAVNKLQREYYHNNKDELNARKRFQRTEFGNLCKDLRNYF